MTRPVLTAEPTNGWLRAADARVADLDALLDSAVGGASGPDTPIAARVECGIPVYEAVTLAAADRAEVQAELAAVLADGAGVLAITGAVPVPAVDRATAVFEQLIAEQRRTGAGAGDHFARPGANDRIWNALEKLALADPAAFAGYYAADTLALVSEAWLGPGYQMTSQVNVVNPGGAPQDPHRDYHLGFMTVEQAQRYPAHVHRLSPALTLQGAVAHSDMPIDSGPTMLLPHSQKYPHGYLVAGHPEFDALFARRHVQLPLRTGDAVFFNPALIHAAGRNRTTDVRRAANLLQVSSAFGRAMEAVDRDRMCRALFPELLRRAPAEVRTVVASAAEGYAFPTNLDLDPPVGGLAPPSQADLLLRAVDERWTPERLDARLDEHRRRR
ncbi:phytanoyl-CoA dioxygenase family protein [Pseudonocardia sp.]|uniref:phytanoyl-CoA dioxygenase family protein n=1 Tax=Pseudonocardia sp. TaxID=60912 RepID=UPI003D0D2C8D